MTDTSVWLDLAKDYRAQPVIAALDDLISANAVELLTPQTVLDEFERSKARVIEESRRSLQSHFRLVREAVSRFADENSKAQTLQTLNEVDHAIVVKADAVNDSIERIENLLKSSAPLPTTDAIKKRVTERATGNEAPYHRGKNSVGDTIIIETYAGLACPVRRDKTTYAFVTHLDPRQ